MPQLTVRNLAGELCWKGGVAPQYAICELRGDLARAIKRPAASLRLLKGAEVLERIDSEDLELTLQVVGPQKYAEECWAFLDSCPEVDTPEHGEWLLKAEHSLLPSLHLLDAMEDNELKSTEQVKSLCVRLLDQERTDWYSFPTERYPDEASVLALAMLRRIAQRGDEEVVRVLKYWLRKMVFHDCLWSENTTSMRTTFEAAKAVPELVSLGDREVLNHLGGSIHCLMNEYCESNGPPAIYLCLEAGCGILTEAYPEEARLFLHELTKFQQHEVYDHPIGKACLILASRLGKMTEESGELNALLQDLGLEVSAEDAVEPATWQNTCENFKLPGSPPYWPQDPPNDQSHSDSDSCPAQVWG